MSSPKNNKRQNSKFSHTATATACMLLARGRRSEGSTIAPTLVQGGEGQQERPRALSLRLVREYCAKPGTLGRSFYFLLWGVGRLAFGWARGFSLRRVKARDVISNRIVVSLLLDHRRGLTWFGSSL